MSLDTKQYDTIPSQTLLSKQLKLERDCISTSIAQYKRSQENLEKSSNLADTTYGRILVPSYVTDIATALDERLEEGTAKFYGKHDQYLRLVKSLKVAFIGLKTVFNMSDTQTTVASVSGAIGARIYDEYKFSIFEKEEAKYYGFLEKEFKERNTRSYRHKVRVLNVALGKLQWSLEDWTPSIKLAIGSTVLECIRANTDLINVYKSVSKGRQVYKFELTQEAKDWILKHKDVNSLSHLKTMPMLVKPDNWSNMSDGGFLSPSMKHHNRLVRVKYDREHINILDKLDSQGSFDPIKKTMNHLQGVGWRINKRVHKVLCSIVEKDLGVGLPNTQPYETPPCPLPEGLDKSNMSEEELAKFITWKREASDCYTRERKRFSQMLQVTQSTNIAGQFKDLDEFFYTWSCDKRGRVYPSTSALSPQGGDYVKGILEFSRGKHLGEEGAYWLAIQGANTYGFDKLKFPERYAKIQGMTDQIKAVVKDPLENLNLWSCADKPYEYLAFCYEYDNYMKVGNSHVNHIHVDQDGTCNGLQHLSAMLRDLYGGRAVNLLDSEEPNDIYRNVSDVVILKLKYINNKDTQFLLDWGITRKTTKKPVMTLPYGSTLSTCKDSMLDLLIESRDGHQLPFKDMFRLAQMLGTIVWESIGEVVVAAVKVLKWLQASSRIITKHNRPIFFTAPNGFKMYQANYSYDTKDVATQLLGSAHLRSIGDTKYLDANKQANGIVPNFTHTLDGCHLSNTVNTSFDKGITAFAPVHDSYGTHACDVPLLRRTTNTEFVKMYYNNNVLQQFKDEQKRLLGIDLPTLPKFGELNILDVLQSTYMFN